MKLHKKYSRFKTHLARNSEKLGENSKQKEFYSRTYSFHPFSFLQKISFLSGWKIHFVSNPFEIFVAFVEKNKFSE